MTGCCPQSYLVAVNSYLFNTLSNAVIVQDVSAAQDVVNAVESSSCKSSVTCHVLDRLTSHRHGDGDGEHLDVRRMIDVLKFDVKYKPVRYGGDDDYYTVVL